MVFLIYLAMFIVILAGFTLFLWHICGQIGAAQQNDLTVYKDQIVSLDAQLESGVIGQSEFENLRAEIGRRMLAAHRQAQEQAPPLPEVRKSYSLVITVFCAVAALGVYMLIGEPNLPDAPLAGRVALSEQFLQNLPAQDALESAAQASPSTSSTEYTALIQQLRDVLQTRFDDLKGHQLLVQTEINVANYAAARAAQKQVVKLLGEKASADEWALLGELSILAAGGIVSKEAEQALRTALKISPTHQGARFNVGLMYVQAARPDLAFQIWAPLLEEAPQSAPFIPYIRLHIDELAYYAGQSQYRQPPL